MTCDTHDWRETGIRRKRVEGSIFKYGTPIVAYVKCTLCGQIGYRKPPSQVVYTWDQGKAPAE